MNSDDRRAARRARREEKRARNRAERIDGLTLERIADMNALYDAAMKSRRGVSWKASVQGYCLHVLGNVHKARQDLLNGEDIRRGFRFLKKRFYYGPTGKVVVRPSREAITRERRKLKAMRRMLDRGEITLRQINQSYQSWRGGMLRLDAHETVLSMDRLYKELFGNEYPPPGAEILNLTRLKAAA